MYHVVRHLDPALAVLAHEGTMRYEELYELVYRREASKPNEIWQAHHTQLDLWVITPSGQSARPWLTIIEDDHSRAIAGYGLNLGAEHRAGIPAGDLARWEELEPMLSRWRRSYTQARDRDDLHTLLYTPTLSVTPRVLSKEPVALGQHLSVIRTAGPPDPRPRRHPQQPRYIASKRHDHSTKGLRMKRRLAAASVTAAA